MKPRNYRHEYDSYHSKPEQRKNRSGRNQARSLLIKKGVAKKGDGKDVDHKVPLAKGGSGKDSNTRVVSQKTNRGWRKKNPELYKKGSK